MLSPSALIDFAAPHADLQPIRLAFGAPDEALVAQSPTDVPRVLDAVEERARRGLWCVGYLRYEAAIAFDGNAVAHAADGPLAYFSVHRGAVPFPDMARDIDRPLRWRETLSRQAFDASIARIHAAIEAGELYQVNYTARLAADYGGDPFALFCALRRSQPGANAAFLATPHEHVLSVSPELFFDWDGRALTCAPMKGTAARGATRDSDARNAHRLQSCAKERAENVMIVDLMRNDLSRIAQLGSVRVSRLFECQAWPTVWQMVSEVTATTRPGITLAQVFGALFPCGSITGAPKLRAMRSIRELEATPRGVYCGAVGVVQPGGAARFNVPIRTVTLREGRASCGVGSGITWGSSAQAEWHEWRHKARFLDQASEPFQLLQTLRLEAGACRDLEMHLDRLEAAAAHFGFVFDRGAVRRQVLQAVRGSTVTPARVRLLLDAGGRASVELSAVPAVPEGRPTACLAPRAIAAPWPFLRHKTTRRGHYDAFEADSASAGAFACLLWNAYGEVTEFTRGSVVIERRGGERVTPSLHCGLLDGVGRARALMGGQVREDTVTIDELGDARRVWFVNALRGWVEVQLQEAALGGSPLRRLRA